jgi:hypothetical protein
LLLLTTPTSQLHILLPRPTSAARCCTRYRNPQSAQPLVRLPFTAHQIIGVLGWKAAASKDVLAIAPGARIALNHSQVDDRRVFFSRRRPRCMLAASQVAQTVRRWRQGRRVRNGGVRLLLLLMPNAVAAGSAQVQPHSSFFKQNKGQHDNKELLREAARCNGQ